MQQYIQRHMKSTFVDMKASFSLDGLECHWHVMSSPLHTITTWNSAIHHYFVQIHLRSKCHNTAAFLFTWVCLYAGLLSLNSYRIGHMSYPKTFDFPHILYRCLSRFAWNCFIFGSFVSECVCEGLNKTKELVQRFLWFCIGKILVKNKWEKSVNLQMKREQKTA